MRDFIIAFREDGTGAVSSDWYRVHKHLTDAIGEVRHGEGRRPWQFSCDPRAIFAGRGTAFVAVRCEGAPAEVMGRIAVAQSDVPVPGAGERVSFAVHFSSRPAARCDMSSLRVAAAARGTSLARESAIALLSGAGLSDVVLDGVRETLFPIWKSARQRRFIPKYGTSAIGSAVVSDPEALGRALGEGVGRDRGLGFGMLFLEAAA